MVEIIVREKVKTNKKGVETWRVQKVFSKPFNFFDAIQVSFNSDYHLVLRLKKQMMTNSEILVVFTMAETKKIIDFVKNNLKVGEADASSH